MDTTPDAEGAPAAPAPPLTIVRLDDEGDSRVPACLRDVGRGGELSKPAAVTIAHGINSHPNHFVVATGADGQLILVHTSTCTKDQDGRLELPDGLVPFKPKVTSSKDVRVAVIVGLEVVGTTVLPCGTAVPPRVEVAVYSSLMRPPTKQGYFPVGCPRDQDSVTVTTAWMPLDGSDPHEFLIRVFSDPKGAVAKALKKTVEAMNAIKHLKWTTNHDVPHNPTALMVHLLSQQTQQTPKVAMARIIDNLARAAYVMPPIMALACLTKQMADAEAAEAAATVSAPLMVTATFGDVVQTILDTRANQPEVPAAPVDDDDDDDDESDVSTSPLATTPIDPEIPAFTCGAFPRPSRELRELRAVNVVLARDLNVQRKANEQLQHQLAALGARAEELASLLEAAKARQAHLEGVVRVADRLPDSTPIQIAAFGAREELEAEKRRIQQLQAEHAATREAHDEVAAALTAAREKAEAEKAAREQAEAELARIKMEFEGFQEVVQSNAKIAADKAKMTNDAVAKLMKSRIKPEQKLEKIREIFA